MHRLFFECLSIFTVSLRLSLSESTLNVYENMFIHFLLVVEVCGWPRHGTNLQDIFGTDFVFNPELH